MALLLFGSYMVRYPLAGNLNCFLQWLYGFQALGHDVYLVETSTGWDCYEPDSNTMGNDPSAGLRIVSELLQRFGLNRPIVFRDYQGAYYGMSEESVADLFRRADCFIDCGNHGAWQDLAEICPLRILIDQEPGFNQMRIANEASEGTYLPHYHAHYTNGCLIPARHPEVPSCGVSWKTVVNPIALDLFQYAAPPASRRFTTIMNWQAHKPLRYAGREFGQKDVEFARFMGLPQRVSAEMEVAVAGKRIPYDMLRSQGWTVRNAHEVSRTFDSYMQYVRESLAEFSVAKNVFVATRSGWFSDRSNCYLAQGRPVVLQDTGFSEYLPCGEGLFAVRDEEEAAAAIDCILANPGKHSRRAREIASEYLSTEVVLSRFLAEIGL